jgi:hypothetical protein
MKSKLSVGSGKLIKLENDNIYLVKSCVNMSWLTDGEMDGYVLVLEGVQIG